MTVTLLPSDVATARVGTITVRNAGSSVISNSVGLAVVAAGASLSVTRIVPVANADLVYDELRGVLYASVPANAGQHANSIVRIDPAGGTVTGSVSAGDYENGVNAPTEGDPRALAITDDGQYLYVGLSKSKILRIALSTFTKDVELDLPSGLYDGAPVAEDILPIPGVPRMIAVATRFTTSSGSTRNAGTYLFDNDIRKTPTPPGYPGSNRITRGATSARIYGYDNEATASGFRSLLVTADGLHEEIVKPGLITGVGADIEYSGGIIYSTSGDVVDPAAMQKLGTIPATGIVRPDASNARVHFLSGATLSTYHYMTFTSIGAFADPALEGHTKLIRWGSDGLAVGGGASIVLLRGALAGP
jgi:hypothetical protein